MNEYKWKLSKKYLYTKLNRKTRTYRIIPEQEGRMCWLRVEFDYWKGREPEILIWFDNNHRLTPTELEHTLKEIKKLCDKAIEEMSF